MRFQWAARRILVFIVFGFLLIFIISKFDHYNDFEDPPDYPDFFDAEKNEIFVKEYLKLMQLGRAPARPVVEKKSEVFENFWCFLRRPEEIFESRNWVRMAGIEVYSAYFDDRPNSLYPENSAIQLLVMSNHSIESKTSIFCNIFTSKSSYSTVKGHIREIWQTGWDPRDTFQIPSLVTCPIPEKLKDDMEMTVSLTRSRCKNSKNSMKVIRVQKPREKKMVAVCVKGLDYQEDISGRLLEWIEMQYLFGADTISIYHFFLNDASHKVLQYYQEKRGLKVIPLTLPPGNSNDPLTRTQFLKSNRPQKRRHELLPYNDCFYDHIHTHEYVLIIDIDEVIVPIRYDNYTSLLRDFESKNSNGVLRLSSISSRNVFKFPSNFTLFPRHQYMISNRKRSRKTSAKGEYGKSFSSTSTVATVFNHFALHKLSPSVAKSQYFSSSDALKLHYKSECPWESRAECHQLEFDVTDDKSLDRFEATLRRRTDEAAKEIF